MIHLFCGYCNKHPKLWDEHLQYIQHAYNRAKHSSTQTLPFEACLGNFPGSPLYFIFGKDVAIDGHGDIEKARSFIEQVQLVHQGFQQQLEKIQGKYRSRHKKHQVDHKFQGSDEVWLHISKERLQGERRNLKPIRYGPFKILEKIGQHLQVGFAFIYEHLCCY